MTRSNESQPTRRGGVIGLVLICLVVFASGCASNNDPSNWEEAIEDGTLEENFMRSCREANVGGGLNVSQVESYCGCAFDGLAQRYAEDFDDFKDAEKRLRNDPNDIDPAVRALLERCVPT
ncbi:MAG: hypothetical protein F4Y27_07865 [Acidimicrobiaceae bacterium]|nr:hypothetical protein [Acidimicrobiaceae bacterium]MYA74576.1 hypothetical protein [Acidimicrobiaceae bacterium]MYD08194.1 hypothetical protein [Acidimicrobiaceae bacterium]MYG54183.1 hypothetical protein [Acidimicrobiaceae bacterium]MYI59971.1 hypothetical protein [Acidimicrobiaceae bacterium]